MAPCHARRRQCLLTPTVKSRPIQVTGSKGIHGTVFSGIRSYCIFMLAKNCRSASTPRSRNVGKISRPSRSKGKPSASSASAPSDLSWRASKSARHARVLATKRTAMAKPDYVDELGTAEFLLQLLMQSDFVVLLLASVPSTFNIIGENELRAMKQSAYLINLTGGRAIEEPLLVRALKEALDCRRRFGCIRQAAVTGRVRTMEPAQRDHHRRASPASPVKNGPRCCRSLRTI